LAAEKAEAVAIAAAVVSAAAASAAAVAFNAASDKAFAALGRKQTAMSYKAISLSAEEQIIFNAGAVHYPAVYDFGTSGASPNNPPGGM
jgi:hypothetical protein